MVIGIMYYFHSHSSAVNLWRNPQGQQSPALCFGSNCNQLWNLHPSKNVDENAAFKAIRLSGDLYPSGSGDSNLTWPGDST